MPEVGITGTPVIDWSTRTLYAGAATLRAFDAADISHQLWSHALHGAGGLNHFDVLTIAGGRVFVGGQDRLQVYGLA